MIARCVATGTNGQRYDWETETFVAHSLTAEGFDASEDGTGRGPPLVTHALPTCNGGGYVSEDGTGHGIPLTLAFHARQDPDSGAVTHPLDTDGCSIAVAYGIGSDAVDRSGEGAARNAAERAGLNIVANMQPSLRARPNNAVAFTERTRADGRNFEAQEDLAYALCNPGSGGRTHSRQLLDPSMSVRRLTPRECERLQGFPDDFTAITYRGKPAADAPRYRALGNSMAVPVIRWILSRLVEIAAMSEERTTSPNRGGAEG